MKTLVSPILVFLGVIVVIVVGTGLLFNTISSFNVTLSSNRQVEATLQSKLTILQSVSSVVTADSQAVTNALPATSPILYVMSNVKSQAASIGLIVNNFTSGEVVGASSSGLLSGEVLFEVEGNYSSVASLVEGIKLAAPLTRFDSIKILNQNVSGADDYKFTGDLFTYWAPFPTSIPAISQPSVGLTADEKSVISKVTSLTVASLVSGTSSAQVNPNRTDPFSP